MNKKQSILILVSLMMVFALVLGGCQPQTIVETVEVEKIVEVEKEVEVVKEVEVEVEVEKEVIVEVEKVSAADNFKLAAVLPGVITDTDYNTLGYVAATAVQNNLGVEMSYSESVPVPDVERVMREYIDGGYNIIFTHGAQFLTQTLDLASQFPDVVFIGEGDGAVEDPPPNFWIIDRNFHTPYYVMGYIAANSTKTGKIGYLSALQLPFSYHELHAIEQAVADAGLDVEIVPVWTGDFNDPTKGRQVADQMIAQDVDVILGSLNLGMFGIFEAAKATGDGDDRVLVTAKYIDKTMFAPNHYVSSALYDFSVPLMDITSSVLEGETGGYYPMEFGGGIDVQLPLQNVDEALNESTTQLVEDIKSGAVVVIEDATPVE
jgi:basic membrane protein A and related proteins